MTAATGSGFSLSEIGQIALSVSDLERAVVFYRDSLGLPFLFEVPNLAFFNCGGVRLMLSPGEDNSESFNSVLYFRVADIQAAHQALVDRGVSFVEEPRLIAKMTDHDLWMGFFRDPDENLLAIMSEVR